MPIMLAPASFANSQVFASPSGSVYQADANGYVNVTNGADVPNLLGQGFFIIPVLEAGSILIAKLVGANMNSTADQALVMLQPLASQFRVTKITCKNASTSLTTAAGGIYRQAAKGGTAMVANTQVYTSLTTSALAADLTLATATTVDPAGTKLWLSLTTAQGATATADIYVFGDIYP